MRALCCIRIVRRELLISLLIIRRRRRSVINVHLEKQPAQRAYQEASSKHLRRRAQKTARRNREREAKYKSPTRVKALVTFTIENLTPRSRLARSPSAPSRLPSSQSPLKPASAASSYVDIATVLQMAYNADRYRPRRRGGAMPDIKLLLSASAIDSTFLAYLSMTRDRRRPPVDAKPLLSDTGTHLHLFFSNGIAHRHLRRRPSRRRKTSKWRRYLFASARRHVCETIDCIEYTFYSPATAV